MNRTELAKHHHCPKGDLCQFIILMNHCVNRTILVYLSESNAIKDSQFVVNSNISLKVRKIVQCI